MEQEEVKVFVCESCEGDFEDEEAVVLCQDCFDAFNECHCCGCK